MNSIEFLSSAFPKITDVIKSISQNFKDLKKYFSPTYSVPPEQLYALWGSQKPFCQAVFPNHHNYFNSGQLLFMQWKRSCCFNFGQFFFPIHTPSHLRKGKCNPIPFNTISSSLLLCINTQTPKSL